MERLTPENMDQFDVQRSEPDGAPTSVENDGSPLPKVGGSKNRSFSSEASNSPSNKPANETTHEGGNSLTTGHSVHQATASNISASTFASYDSSSTAVFGLSNAGPTMCEQPKIRPGEFVMRILFSEFTAQAEKKIESVISDSTDFKLLQRGEDPIFDQLLTALGSVAEHCLPSILRTLFSWYDRQSVNWLGSPMASGSVSSGTSSSLTSGVESLEKGQLSMDPLVLEKRDMAVEFIFCLVLIEVLKQLPFHPGHHDLVGKIEDLAFIHFKYREGTGVNAAHGLMIADLYAEVLGVLAQARFASVRVRFLSELADLRGKEANASITQSIISLLMGMKFFRIKMAPIEDFETSFQFLTECAKYFLEVKQRDIKHALAGLFVEILVPVAATVKHEVNVPCLKNFVEMLYSPTLDMCTRSKHRLAIFPLVTCLLCVSQKQFFLHNWHYFLAMCLSQLKSREPKMSRVALESLYRLLWAYMIRIKCESNSATQSRLLSVVNSLFPKGSKGVVPRDTPLNIFVKIIQFIAQERLDFAMRDIVFELLSVGRPIKIILTPERMNIGLRAFLVAADSLQQKDGDPPMPRSANVMPSGNTLLRVKKTFLNKVLTEDAARSIGMASYFPLIRKVFTEILRALDLQCGRPLMLTSVKEQEESLLTGDRKAKIDLFRTCVAAIPRLIPDGMSRSELLSLLSRLTLHIDEELRGLAFQSLQSLLIDFPDWRNDVLSEFVTFTSKEVPDTSPQQLDNALRMLLQLLTSWRGISGDGPPIAATINKKSGTVGEYGFVKGRRDTTALAAPGPAPNLATFYQTEGLALLMLCSVRSPTRRLAAHILKEIKGLADAVGVNESPVIDVIDKVCAAACEKMCSILPAGERVAVLSAISSSSLDLQWLTDRNCPAWYAQEDENLPPPTTSTSLSGSLSILQPSVSIHNFSTDVSVYNDAWAMCLKHFLDTKNVTTQCPRAVLESWSILMAKINSLYSYLEPVPLQDNRASLLRSAAAPRKPPTNRSMYLKLWRNYLLFAFRTVPPSVGSTLRCISPEMAASSSPEASEGREGKSPLPLTSAMFSVTPSTLYKLVIPLIRSDITDIRDLTVYSLGHVNHLAVKDLFEDIASYLKEACDRKQENVRRRKRKDNLRLQILRMLEIMAKENTFGKMASNLSHSFTSSSLGHHLSDSGSMLPQPVTEFLESCKGWLENETDREGGVEMRLKCCTMIYHLLNSFDLDLRENVLKRETRKQLFQLCISWAGSYAFTLGKEGTTSRTGTNCSPESAGSTASSQETQLDFAALQAAVGLLTCGPIFQTSLLSEDSHMFTWIDSLLSSSSPNVVDLGKDTVILLLEFNPDAGALLDTVVGRCFTGSSQIADACFKAIATLFSAREYPCDRYVAIINTALLYSGSGKVALQQTAFRLLQILDRRFFGGLSPLHLHPPGMPHGAEDVSNTLDSLLNRLPYAKDQKYLSKQLSLLHPELTMPMFSEISWRMKSARPDVRQSLLRYLQPWLRNMELIDPAIPSPNVLISLKAVSWDGSCDSSRHFHSSSSSCSLCGRKFCDEIDRCVSRGWGSTEATEMVLNNLMYLTAKFGEEHCREIEECWETLCCASVTNQRVVLFYLLIVTGLAPNEILPHAKRIVVYLFRARPLKLLEDLTAELQTVESLSWLIERTETPPFYRLSHLRKASSYSDTNGGPCANGAQNVNSSLGNATLGPNNHVTPFSRVNAPTELEKGTIHTKRRSAEEPGVFQHPPPQPHLRSSSSGAAHLFRSEKTRTISGPAALPDTHGLVSDRSKYRATLYESEVATSDFGQRSTPRCPSSDTIAAVQPFGKEDGSPIENECETNDMQSKFVPLPMPEYGGYYAPLKEFLPPQPVAPFHRCNLALMFVCELINEGTTLTISNAEEDKKRNQFDWCSQYIPLMIHMAFLGLDHIRPLVHQHSYNLLINLITVATAHKNHFTVAKLLLNQTTMDMKLGLTIPHVSVPNINFLEKNAVFAATMTPAKSTMSETIAASSPSTQSPCPSSKSSPQTPSKRVHTPVNILVVTPEPQEYYSSRPLNTEEMTLSLIKYLAEHKGQPLWNCEDITARLWNIRSANQLSALLQNSLNIFVQSYPSSYLEKRWAQVALQIGLACPSRHYAGRSLQVLRALRVPLVTRVLGDILSRLVETVAEPGDDMQGYVTELILTLEASIDAIVVTTDPENGDIGNGDYMGKVEMEDEKFVSPRKDESSSIRPRSGTETYGGDSKRPDLPRSRSVQSLVGFDDGRGDDTLERLTQENGIDVITQVFWLAISLLESDYEHEYLLALKLLDKAMERLPLDHMDCRDKLDRVHNQLQWNSFNGCILLVLKGCTNPNTFEQSLAVLCRFIPLLDLSFVDPTGETGFPLTVMAILPFLLLHYDDPTQLCVQASKQIAEVAANKGEDGNQPLQHLSTVMTLYSRRSFSKESFQWTKCVIKYLYDSYSHLAPMLLGFLLDVLEKGPSSIQPALLTALNCSFNYVDLTTVNTVSTDLLRAISKHLDGQHWKESLRILKLVVTRSSCLVAPPQHFPSYSGSSGPSSMAWDTVSTASSGVFCSDVEFNGKKELPGRTMEFTFDVSQTPIIGRKYVSSTPAGKDGQNVNGSSSGWGGGTLAQRSSSVGEMGGNVGGSSSVVQSAWKRPWQCQSRVRECLVNVLNACGQRVGLPKSPSVVFSQSSELLERQSSVASSTEEVSGAINDVSGASRIDDGSASDAQFRVFRDFDFLEYELESVEGESNDNFNWGVRRRPFAEFAAEPETEGETENETLTATTSSHSQVSSDASFITTVHGPSSSTARRPVDMQIQSGNPEESSDEEEIGLSPLDEVDTPLEELIEEPRNTQSSSLTMIETTTSSQVSSPARSRRLSEGSMDSRSEEESTPCNTSSQDFLVEIKTDSEETPTHRPNEFTTPPPASNFLTHDACKLPLLEDEEDDGEDEIL